MRKFRIGLMILLAGILLFAQAAPAEEVTVESEAAVEVEASVETLAEEGGEDESQEPFVRWLQCTVEGAQINVQPTQYGDTLFLPTCADLSSLHLTACGDAADAPLVLMANDRQAEAAAGEAVDVAALFPDGADEEGVYGLTVLVSGEEKPLRIRQSENQASLYVISADPENRGHAYVDGLADPKGDPITDAALLMLDETGEVVYDNALRELRGRGNTTWQWGIKKPYQIKLEKKTDLLQSGNEDNKDRTWLLMAESFDATLVHNMLTLHLGQEMGLEGTVEFRPVDLYYDGDYCGFYLLSEKVNVKPGRLNILEMDDLIEQQYPQVAEESLHPVVEEETDIGKIRYVSGVETAFGQDGAYLIELDSYGGFAEESMFETANENMYEIRSPEYAGRADVVYVQQLTNDLMLTVANGGVHPTDGRQLEELIDSDSLARYLLIQQFAKTADFGYTSTYLYLPEGSAQFKAGPLWDFDIAYAIRDNRPYEVGIDGYVAGDRWVYAAMDVPVVQTAMRQIWQTELEPLIQNVVLGDADAKQGNLRSLGGYYAATEASRRMNYDLWQLGGSYNNINYDTLFETYDENWAFFVSYIEERTAWMTGDMEWWSADTIDQAALHLSYINADVPGSATLEPVSPFQRTDIVQVDWNSQPVEETPWHAIYTVDVQLKARAGSQFAQNATASVNGQPATVLSLTDTEMTLRFAFEGPVYEEAVYEGVDYGLVYNYHYYVNEYPELLEEYGEDPAAILENYVFYDFSSGFSGIETFDYDLYYEAYMEELDAYFYSDTYGCMMYYLDNEEEEPLLGLGEVIIPGEADFVEVEPQ